MLHAVSEPRSLWGISIEEYAQRRARLAQQLEADQMVVLASEPPAPTRMRYRQESHFMYLTGVETPNAVLVILPPNSPTGESEVLFLARQSRLSQIFEGLTFQPDKETESATGIRVVRPISELSDFLRDALSHHPKVLLHRPARPGYAETLRSLQPEVEVLSIERAMAELRLVKSPAELRLIRKAVEASMEAHHNLACAIKPGVYEYELEAIAQATFRRHGSEHEAYPCIIGSGPDRCILHYNANKRRMQAGELVLVDIGAEYSYYAADITRTYPVSGKFSKRQRELYLAILSAKKAVEQYARPGMTLRDLHQRAVEVLRSSPLRARDASGEERTLDAFFVHGLSHMMGMDVHDPDLGKPLQPGMVFTIEPGVYIPTENIGIRIEDDYLMTGKGVVNLSSALPTEPDAIERMMRLPRAPNRSRSPLPLTWSAGKIGQKSLWKRPLRPTPAECATESQASSL